MLKKKVVFVGGGLGLRLVSSVRNFFKTTKEAISNVPRFHDDRSCKLIEIDENKTEVMPTW